MYNQLLDYKQFFQEFAYSCWTNIFTLADKTFTFIKVSTCILLPFIFNFFPLTLLLFFFVQPLSLFYCLFIYLLPSFSGLLETYSAHWTGFLYFYVIVLSFAFFTIIGAEEQANDFFSRLRLPYSSFSTTQEAIAFFSTITIWFSFYSPSFKSIFSFPSPFEPYFFQYLSAIYRIIETSVCELQYQLPSLWSPCMFCKYD